MSRKSWFWSIVGAAILAVIGSTVQAGNAVLEFRAQDLATYAAREELGTFHVLEFTVPEGVTGKRVDAVLLELYVDVALNEGGSEGTTPVLEVLPLTEAFAGDGAPEFASTSTAVRNVVPGERKKLLLDITEIVKGWITDPRTNHGVVIGTLTGPREGTFTLRDDVLGGGVVAKVTFVYQNRFGGRVSHQGSNP